MVLTIHVFSCGGDDHLNIGICRGLFPGSLSSTPGNILSSVMKQLDDQRQIVKIIWGCFSVKNNGPTRIFPPLSSFSNFSLTGSI